MLPASKFLVSGESDQLPWRVFDALIGLGSESDWDAYCGGRSVGLLGRDPWARHCANAPDLRASSSLDNGPLSGQSSEASRAKQPAQREADMGKANDRRPLMGRTNESRIPRDGRKREVRTSRCSVAMTAESASVIQVQADCAGRQKDVKALAWSSIPGREAPHADEGEE